MKELVALGLAHLTEGGRYRVTSDGHNLLGAVMRRNGERWKQWDQQRSN